MKNKVDSSLAAMLSTQTTLVRHLRTKSELNHMEITSTLNPISTAQVYIAYHDARPVLNSYPFIPIQVGRTIRGNLIPGIIGDDEGDNISHLNSSFSELTAQYWAWKNTSFQGHVGLMHYRRFLDLTDEFFGARHSEIYLPNFEESAYLHNSRTWINNLGDQCALLPRPLKLNCTVRQQYVRAHKSDDLYYVEKIIAKNYIDFAPYFSNYLGQSSLLLGNIFIMPRDVFEHYSSMVFNILFLFNENYKKDYSLSTYQARYPGFIAERILSAFILSGYAQECFPNLQIIFKTLLNIDISDYQRRSSTQKIKSIIDGRIGFKDAVKYAIQTKE